MQSSPDSTTEPFNGRSDQPLRLTLTLVGSNGLRSKLGSLRRLRPPLPSTTAPSNFCCFFNVGSCCRCGRVAYPKKSLVRASRCYFKFMPRPRKLLLISGGAGWFESDHSTVTSKVPAFAARRCPSGLNFLAYPPSGFGTAVLCCCSLNSPTA